MLAWRMKWAAATRFAGKAPRIRDRLPARRGCFQAGDGPGGSATASCAVMQRTVAWSSGPTTRALTWARPSRASVTRPGTCGAAPREVAAAMHRSANPETSRRDCSAIDV